MIGVIFATLIQGIFFAGVVMLFVGGLLGKMGIITISSSKTIATWSVILMMVYFFMAIGKNMNEYNYNKRANQVVGTWESKKEDEIISFSDKNEFYSTKKYEYTILTCRIEPNSHKLGIFTPDNDMRPVDYKYKVKGKKLTLTDEDGKSIVYKRKSKEYQGGELFKERFEGYSPNPSYKLLDGIWKDGNGDFYMFEDSSGMGSTYKIVRLEYDDKESKYIPLANELSLSFDSSGGVYYDKKIKPNAYTFGINDNGRYIYGVSSDNKELRLWSTESNDVWIFKFVEEYSVDKLSATVSTGINSDIYNNISSDENALDNTALPDISLYETISQEDNEGFENNWNNPDSSDYLGNAKADEYFEEDFYNEDYIIPDSSSRYLTDEDLENLSLEELKLARNELYAKKGRIFNSAELKEYFKNKWWYEPRVEGEIMDGKPQSDYFNEYEIANLQLIKEWEEKRQ